MSLVNFRVDDELKKKSYGIISDLGTNPTDVFKNVLKFIVENKKLPVHEVLMSNQDLQKFKKANSNNIENVFAFTHQNGSNCINTIVSANTGSGSISGIETAIQSHIAKGNSVLIANPYLSSSQSFIDKVIFECFVQHRPFKRLDLNYLIYEDTQPQLYYNPLRGKNLATSMAIAIALNPEVQFSEALKLANLITDIAIAYFTVEDYILTFQKLEAFAAHILKPGQIDDNHPYKHLDGEVVRGLELMQSGCKLVLQTPLAKLVDDSNKEDQQCFNLGDLLKEQCVCLVEHHLDPRINESLSVLGELLSMDMQMSAQLFMDSSLFQCHPLLLVSATQYLFTDEFLIWFARNVRKTYGYTIYSIPELSHLNPSKQLLYQVLFQLAHNIFLFNTDSSTVEGSLTSLLYPDAIKQYNKLNPTEFLPISFTHYQELPPTSVKKCIGAN